MLAKAANVAQMASNSACAASTWALRLCNIGSSLGGNRPQRLVRLARTANRSDNKKTQATTNSQTTRGIADEHGQTDVFYAEVKMH
jgi:hypothetical protein